MVVERRLSILISAAAAFILLTALWNVFVRPGHRVRAGPVPDAPTIVESVHTGDSAARAAAAAPPPVPTPAAAAPTSPPLALQPPGDEGRSGSSAWSRESPSSRTKKKSNPMPRRTT